MIAAVNALDLGSSVFDNPSGLMPYHHRPHRDAPLALHDMIISATESHGCDAHQHFCGGRRIKLDALD